MLFTAVNSTTRCSRARVTHTLRAMADKRKPLEPWQQDDAARLKALFDAKWHSSQDAFGEAFDLGSQGNVWQYLNARTPLNIGAVALLIAAVFLSASFIVDRLDRIRNTLLDK